MSKKEHHDQLEDIVDVHDQSITLSDIEAIANDENILKQYEKENKDSFYSSLLLSLTHETYSEPQAKRLWNEITKHMNHLNHSLGRKTGISVAALDYLSNIKQILNEPKIIEEEKSAFVAQSSTIDELTQLHTKDVFHVTLKKHTDEAIRSDTSLCMLMIDIDDFKIINDQYGHQVGDEVLKSVGHCINGIVREMDLAARYGGEELAVILPNSSIKDAYKTAERIRKSINQLKFAGFSITVSIGVSSTEGNTKNTPELLIKKADEALYKAKETGKNKTIK